MGPQSESESESDLELEGDDRRVEVRGEMRGGTLLPRGWLEVEGVSSFRLGEPGRRWLSIWVLDREVD